MGGKEAKQRMINGGSPYWHSSNQVARKTIRDRGEKAFGQMDRAVRAERRREEKEQLLEDERLGIEFLPERKKMQFYRALNCILEGKVTLEEVLYIESLEKRVEYYTTDKGNNVTILIVDFTQTNDVDTVRAA